MDVLKRNKQLEEENKKLKYQVIKLKNAIAYITNIDYPYLAHKHGDDYVYGLLKKTYKGIIENEKYQIKKESVDNGF